MIIRIALGLLVVLALFVVYVASKDGHFRYERSGLIHAPAEKIFPFISDFRKGQLWNPYDRRDPNVQRKFSGPDAQVGSFYEFAGKSGTGTLEITKLVPNSQVEMTLQMIKPFKALNHVTYSLQSQADGTLFTWAMEGDGGFMGKLMGTLIDCEKMIGKDFDEGIAQLKVEAEK